MNKLPPDGILTREEYDEWIDSLESDFVVVTDLANVVLINIGQKLEVRWVNRSTGEIGVESDSGKFFSINPYPS